MRNKIKIGKHTIDGLAPNELYNIAGKVINQDLKKGCPLSAIIRHEY
jgi:hypothetical protein